MWRCRCLQLCGPPNDVFSGGAIVNCTGPAAGVTSPARRSAMTAVAIRAMVDSAATSHATRFDRAGGVTVRASAPSLDPDATHLRSRQQIARALIPVVRILREARADDAVERRRGDAAERATRAAARL